MAHKLISDEMVEKAANGFVGQWGNVFLFDRTELQKDIRAALEAVADEIRNQVIEECAAELEARHLQAWSAGAGSHTIRRLKSQGQ
jgi:hypothetical protein